MMDKWIPIKDKRPPKKTEVLLTDGEKVGISQLFICEAGTMYIQLGMTPLIKKPTHWMAVPKPPRGGT